jgi:hypothetical protein
MALILAAAYLCLGASLSSQHEMQPRLDAIQNARVAIALMAADLRAACPLDPDSEFLGMSRNVGQLPADNLDFATHNYTPRHEHEGDFCEESLFLAKGAGSGELGLWRRRNPAIAPDPLSGGRREEIATGVLGLRFEYFDGLDWYDTWGDPTGKAKTSNRDQPNIAGMPQAVRITLWLDASPESQRQSSASPSVESAEKSAPTSGGAGMPADSVSLDSSERLKKAVPLVFQTVVQLNLSGAAQPSSNGSAAGSDQNSPGGATQGNP